MYVLLGAVIVLVGLDNQVVRWGSTKINWFKLACMRYGVRGLFALLGSILLICSKFKDPSPSPAESVSNWSYNEVLSAVLASSLMVTLAGYGAVYIISQTETPTVMSALMSVGIMVSGLVIGWLFFSEQVSKVQFCGIVLAVVSVVLMNYSQPNLPVEPPSSITRALLRRNK